MKAITLIQPWASLIMMGAKKFETRSWSTKYRGPLLIHASSKRPKDHQIMGFNSDPLFNYFIPDINDLPYGAIIGRVELVGIYQTEGLTSPQVMFKDQLITPQEQTFGDFSDGRYAWTLEEVTIFKTPIPWGGSLRIWEFPDNKIPKV